MAKKKFYDTKKKTKKPIRYWGYPKERDYILENMALLISSGIGITEAVNIVSSGIKSRMLKRLLTDVIEELDNGSVLWKALDGTGFLDENYINLIKVGEESGRLVENLKMIVTQQQKDRTFRAKVKSAMMYPAIVFTLIIVIGLAISWFILPKLMNAFSGMNVNVPLVTKILMNFGNFLQLHGIIFVPSFIAGLFLLSYLFFINKKLRFIGQAILLHTPGLKQIITESEIARFGFVLSGLLNSGLPVVETLNSLSKTSVYSPYTKLYNYLSTKVEEGYSFQKAFTSYKRADKLIPTPIQQMVFAGERSGNLPDVLGKISEIYEEKVDISTENFAILIEPILLFVVWLGVLAIALAVILPIYSLIGSMGI